MIRSIVSVLLVSFGLASGAVPEPPVGAPLSPDRWTGQSFVLLTKNSLLSSYGYELYPTAKCGAETVVADLGLFTKEHRLLSTFAGHSVVAKSAVKLATGEYALSFELDTLGLMLYSKTRQGIVEGLLLKADLDAARNRFVGKTIWAKKRTVTTADMSTGRFDETAVNLRTPLTVIEAVPGSTPLPTGAIWLKVKGGPANGFIPVNCSWTMVPKASRKNAAPWSEDVLDIDPTAQFKWDPYVWETIDAHNVFAGMTEEQVRMSWGPPKKITAKVVKGSTKKQTLWQYDGSVLTFESGVLVQ